VKIILVRHGHVEGIEPERSRGRADLRLTDLGQRQAQVTAERIKSSWTPTAVYSSPLNRCVTTAESIAARLGLVYQQNEGLLDIDYGEWQGLTPDEARVQWSEEVVPGIGRRTW
jgi:broad specificity phosphatase PhoE